MKKIRVLIVVVAALLAVASVVLAISTISNNKAVRDIESIEITKMPTIDFVQPWMFEGYEEADYDRYYNGLKELGYDTIIVQMTRSEEEKGVSTFYYDTKIETSDCYKGEVAHVKDYLKDIMKGAAKHNFQVYMGLSVEEISWWALTCYYDKAYMNRVADIDCYMVKELYDNYSSKYFNSKGEDILVGWYFAYELFSNPVGWENLWAPIINKVIDTINSLEDNRPLMLSPFRQYQLGPITNEYLMWKNFFRQVNFREGDIFVPQDSMGKLNQDGKISNQSYKYVHKYLDQIEKAIKDDGRLRYWVNVEIYQMLAGEGESDLKLGNFDRCVMQIKNANRVAEKLVTFSASHYMVIKRDLETQEYYDEFVRKYKELLENGMFGSIK